MTVFVGTSAQGLRFGPMYCLAWLFMYLFGPPIWLMAMLYSVGGGGFDGFIGGSL